VALFAVDIISVIYEGALSFSVIYTSNAAWQLHLSGKVSHFSSLNKGLKGVRAGLFKSSE